LFIYIKIERISYLIKKFQTNDPIGHLVHDMMMNLNAFLQIKCKDHEMFHDKEMYSTTIHENKQKIILEKYDGIITQCILPRFEQLIVNNPSFKMFQLIRIFDPSQKTRLSSRLDSYYDIPIVEKFSKQPNAMQEWCQYINYDVNTLLFPDGQSIIKWWQYNASDFPNLSEVAICLLSIPPSSADVERAFSKHTSILSDQRTNLTFDNLAKYCFIAYNDDIANEI
jgi:hAT family protein